MSHASEILASSASVTHAETQALRASPVIEKDWEHESTLYIFDDTSVLVISGPQLNAFADRAAADEALAA